MTDMRRTGALAVAAVLLATFSLYARAQTDELDSSPAAANSALTDNAATAEVKGAVAQAVNTTFTYDPADPAENARAVSTHLTGQAVAQHRALFKDVVAAKLVLSTKVSRSAVRTLQDGTARLLVFADQTATGTEDGQTSYSEALIAVDAVRHGGRWQISNLDTFQ